MVLLPGSAAVLAVFFLLPSTMVSDFLNLERPISYSDGFGETVLACSAAAVLLIVAVLLWCIREKPPIWCYLLLLVMGLVREVLGNASVFGVSLNFLADYRISLMSKAPGGFMVASILAGVVSKLGLNKEECHGNCMTGIAAGLGECCCSCEEKEVQE